MIASTDWGITGSQYENYENIFVPAMVAEWAQRVLALANPQPGEHILDVCCGTGVLTHLAAHAVGPLGHVVGLDLNPEMLAVARAVTASSPVSKVIEWREGNADALPFEVDCFDVVFCELGLMFFADRVANLKEMLRVLKPGGRLVIMVWGSINHSPGPNALLKNWQRYFNPESANLDPMHTLADPKMILSLLDNAGFNDISVQEVMGTARFPSVEQYVRLFGKFACIEADAPTCDQVISDVETDLQPYIGPEGLVCPMEAILGSARKNSGKPC